MTLKIACLGWGSLIWESAKTPTSPLAVQHVRDGLESAGGTWRSDGPALPLELAREAWSGDDPYISWVITPGSPLSLALWTPLVLSRDHGRDLDAALVEASTALAVREGVAVSRIGRWPAPLGELGAAGAKTIGAWASAEQIDGVVWTALTPKWNDEARAPTSRELLDWLRALVAAGRGGFAETYVRRTPSQTCSRYRSMLESELGWTAITDDRDR